MCIEKLSRNGTSSILSLSRSMHAQWPENMKCLLDIAAKRWLRLIGHLLYISGDRMSRDGSHWVENEKGIDRELLYVLRLGHSHEGCCWWEKWKALTRPPSKWRMKTKWPGLTGSADETIMQASNELAKWTPFVKCYTFYLSECSWANYWCHRNVQDVPQSSNYLCKLWIAL